MNLSGEGPRLQRQFAATYRRQACFVARAVRAFGVPSQDVDDAVQEVFLVLHRRWRELRPDAALEPWLYVIARGVSRNRCRAQSRRRLARLAGAASADGGEPVASGAAPDECAAARQGLDHLRAALERLAPALRTVYLLAELGEWTAAEIALLLGRPRNTISSRLRIARRHVRGQLARAGERR